MFYVFDRALKKWRASERERERGGGRNITRLYYKGLWNHWLFKPNFEYKIFNLQLAL